MKQKRKMLSANFAAAEGNKMPTLLSVSERSQEFLARLKKTGGKVRMVLEIDANGVLSSSLEADSDMKEQDEH